MLCITGLLVGGSEQRQKYKRMYLDYKKQNGKQSCNHVKCKYKVGSTVLTMNHYLNMVTIRIISYISPSAGIISSICSLNGWNKQNTTFCLFSNFSSIFPPLVPDCFIEVWLHETVSSVILSFNNGTAIISYIWFMAWSI